MRPERGGRVRSRKLLSTSDPTIGLAAESTKQTTLSLPPLLYLLSSL